MSADEGPAVAARLTLDDALSLAFEWNPELAERYWETRAGEARVRQADVIPNPELDFRVYRLDEQAGRRDVWRRRAVVRQDLELGGKRNKRAEVARSEQAIDQAGYEAERADVGRAVRRRFAALLGAQRRVESHRAATTFFDEMRRNVQSLVASGAVGNVAAHRVDRQAGLARIDLDRAEFDLSAAKFRLAAMWGSTAPAFDEAVGDLEHSAPLPDLDTVLAMARQSPVHARWDAEVSRSRAVLSAAKAERIPDLQFGAGVRWTDWNVDYLADVSLPLPLFDRKRGEVVEARHLVEKARAAERTAETAVGRRVAEAYFALAESAARRRTLAEEILPAVRATFEAYRTGLESRTGYLDEFFDARRDLTKTEDDYTDALVEYHQALADLEGLLGQPLAGGDYSDR